MVDFHKRIQSLFERNDLSDKDKLHLIVLELKKCKGSITVNERNRLIYIDSSCLEDYLYSSFDDTKKTLPYFEAEQMRNADIAAIRYVLTMLNDCIKEKDMIFFYENHILGISYRSIYKRHGFSRTKCTAANARIQLNLHEKFNMIMTDRGKYDES